uniref:Uncharacterized protein n=1 Tax=Anguilla anguilla TaxID=7936 RepID=A0A0E9VQ48_ANGAN
MEEARSCHRGPLGGPRMCRCQTQIPDHSSPSSCSSAL